MMWRPAPNIRVKALGLHWRGDALLVMDVLSDDGSLKGVRPLGGTVEFGEPWPNALVREFQEELRIDVDVIGAPFVFENIYEHEGAQGHEIVFLADVVFPDGAFDGRSGIFFEEDNGAQCRASWRTLDEMRRLGLALYPDGLDAALSCRVEGSK